MQAKQVNARDLQAIVVQPTDVATQHAIASTMVFGSRSARWSWADRGVVLWNCVYLLCAHHIAASSIGRVFRHRLMLNLALALLPGPDILQTIGSALRNVGLIWMGFAVICAGNDPAGESM